MTLIVAIVNFNSGDDTARLLRQLAAQTDVELRVLVIDSASQDDSLIKAKDAASSLDMSVGFIEPGRNVGYTGNNLILETADDDVFIVNPDVQIDDRYALSKLHRRLRSDAKLAAVAPRIRTAEGIEYTDSVVDISQARAYHPAPEAEHLQSTADRQIPWLNGAALLLRHEAITNVGLLDDRFFLFYEEVDWCVRATELGWSLLLVGDVEVRHRRSSSFTGTKAAFYVWRNIYLLCCKHPVPGWQRAYRKRIFQEATSARAFYHGHAKRAFQGYLAAKKEWYGPAPEDRS